MDVCTPYQRYDPYGTVVGLLEYTPLILEPRLVFIQKSEVKHECAGKLTVEEGIAADGT